MMTFKHDLDIVKVNQHAKHQGQMSFSSKVYHPYAQTHTRPTALLGPLKWSVKNQKWNNKPKFSSCSFHWQQRGSSLVLLFEIFGLPQVHCAGIVTDITVNNQRYTPDGHWWLCITERLICWPNIATGQP